ncbi:MAG: radical SAM protein [Nitrososphaeraceae archaeon]
MPVDTIRTIKLLGNWSGNRVLGRRRPLIAVFSLTHYCNFYCPMCPFGDADKISQIDVAKKNDLTTEQWELIFDKVSKYCIWSIIEGGEPTSRPDFMELVRYIYKLKIPITLITNCSLLHTIDLAELKRYIQFVTCSIDSVYEESYCKIRGVSPQVYSRVINNLHLLADYKIPHYFNSVITKYNTEEFINQSYFERAKELGSNAVSFTFVEDRSDVSYSLLPDRQTMAKVCESILDYRRKHASPQIMIPPQYFEQIIEHGRGLFDECGVWKSIFVNGNGTVLVPCWKFNSPQNTYNLLEQSIEEIWSAPQWDIARTCHDCKVLGCIWYSSQPITTFAKNYMNGLSKMISQQKPGYMEGAC